MRLDADEAAADRFLDGFFTAAEDSSLYEKIEFFKELLGQLERAFCHEIEFERRSI